MTDSMTGLNPRLHTRLCDLVGVEYPIVQTGMGYVAGASLAAATANAGGLGIIASATMVTIQSHRPRAARHRHAMSATTPAMALATIAT